ncbi:MAG: hypothetical protein IKE74_09250 [Mogibacterium sp.]|nr:hypothetical protein [Mogibacterium sp.]
MRKEDRIITIIMILTVLMGVLMLSVGRFIMGGIVLLIAFAIFLNRGGGRFNDRSIYEKIVKTDMEIGELYEKIRDIDTPLGKGWIAEHKGFPGDSIVYGPSRYKDCIVISKKKGSIDIKHITALENIIRKSGDEYRFGDLADTSGVVVTPERYSAFASMKLISVMLLKHLYELTEKLSADRNAAVPDELDFFRFYYHNSSEGHFRNSDGDDILRVESNYRPFSARIMDEDGEEMASVMPHAFNAKGVVIDSAGYELFANGEHFGEIRKFKAGNQEGYIVDTDAGEFRVKIFPACMRANISCNHTIEHEGKLKAVIGGSPNLLFDEAGRCQNDLVLSYDDDYLVLYAALEIFLLTLNRKYLK